MNQPIIRYLNAFHNLLTPMLDENVVLAGTNALKLHGLQMSRESNDLDVVIFKPTEKQLNYLKSMMFFQLDNPYAATSYNEDELNNVLLRQKSIKFKKGELTIDFLLCHDLDIPINLLEFKFNGMYYKVQNIKLNIEAKMSYTINNNDLTVYSRNKDMKDLIDLKNSNFNF